MRISYATGQAAVWGVFVQNGLVYASDINTGLYILRSAAASDVSPFVISQQGMNTFTTAETGSVPKGGYGK